MKTLTFRVLAMVATAALGVSATQAASLTNLDGETLLITVTEGSDRVELAVDPEETVEFCGAGCFITLPNGDRQALQGDETIEIIGGNVSQR